MPLFCALTDSPVLDVYAFLQIEKITNFIFCFRTFINVNPFGTLKQKIKIKNKRTIYLKSLINCEKETSKHYTNIVDYFCTCLLE